MLVLFGTKVITHSLVSCNDENGKTVGGITIDNYQPLKVSDLVISNINANTGEDLTSL